jgi:hypothetical protein
VASACNDLGLGNVCDRKLVEEQNEEKIFICQTNKYREKQTVKEKIEEPATFESPL